MAEQQQQIEGSVVITGDIEVLGDVKNSQISSIVTKVETVTGAMQTVSAKVDTLLLGFADDGVITPTEKITIRNTFDGIKAEYAGVVSRATSRGIPQENIDTYTASFLALQAFLYAVPGILVEMGTDTVVARAEYSLAFDSYLNAKEVVIADIDEAISNELTTLGIDLIISTFSVKRDRAQILTPPQVSCQAAYSDGGAFSGRFKIQLFVDGVWVEVYSSVIDENFYLYTIPATYTGVYVDAVRFQIYQPGGAGNYIKQETCIIDMVPSTAVRYWGTRTSDPTDGFIPGDYYFDSNVPASGGGFIRYFTGTLWVEYTPLIEGYSEAMATAINDIMQWSTENPTGASGFVTAANAIFGAIAASSAFIQKLSTQELEVLGTLRTGAGAATNARVAIQDKIGITNKVFTPFVPAAPGYNDLYFTLESAVAGSFKIIIESSTNDHVILEVGPSGAKVFYFNQSTGYAIEVATIDNGEMEWANILNTTYANAIAAESGLANTNNIIAATTESAAKSCSLFSQGGNTGWHLPSKNELQAMYENKIALGGFSDNLYWSSSEINQSKAYAIDFTNGVTYSLFKRQTAISLLGSVEAWTCNAYNNKLYVSTSNAARIEVYDLINDLSTTITLLNIVTSIFTSQMIGSVLYRIQSGGVTVQQVNLDTLDNEIYYTSVNGGKFCSVVSGGKIYIPISGANAIEILDPATKTSRSVALSGSMTRTACALYNNKIYIRQSGGTTLEIFDITTETTRTITMPITINTRTMNIYNGNLYIIPNNVGTSSVEIFNLTSETTRTVAVTQRARYSNKIFGTKMYIPIASSSNLLEIFDLSAETMSTITMSVTALRYTAEVIFDRLLVPAYSYTSVEIIPLKHPEIRPVRAFKFKERFQWKENSGSYSAPIDITANQEYTLGAYGIKAAFSHDVGHKKDDFWTFIQEAMMGLSIKDRLGVEYFRAENGNVRIATAAPSSPIDGAIWVV